jgi:hypothetical protein
MALASYHYLPTIEMLEPLAYGCRPRVPRRLVSRKVIC